MPSVGSPCGMPLWISAASSVRLNFCGGACDQGHDHADEVAGDLHALHRPGEQSPLYPVVRLS